MDLLKRLDKKTQALLKRIGDLADVQEVHAYLVGGPARDLWLDEPSLDVDIVIEGNAMAFAKDVAEGFEAKVQTYPAFKTATITLPDGRLVDFATARKEKYVRPGAFPMVAVAGIKDDLFRRDFTINAIAISINAASWGDIIDPYAGLNDLKAKKIRVLHKKSFVDDPTRILRALRFKDRFGFKLEKATAVLLNKAIVGKALDTIRPQRYKKEYDKILKEKHSARMLESVSACGAIQGKNHG